MSDEEVERQLTKLEDEVTELRGLLVEANGQTIDAMEREQKLLAERDALLEAQQQTDERLEACEGYLRVYRQRLMQLGEDPAALINAAGS